MQRLIEGEGCGMRVLPSRAYSKCCALQLKPRCYIRCEGEFKRPLYVAYGERAGQDPPLHGGWWLVVIREVTSRLRFLSIE